MSTYEFTYSLLVSLHCSNPCVSQAENDVYQLNSFNVYLLLL